MPHLGTLGWDLGSSQHLSLCGGSVGHGHRALTSLLDSARAESMRICHEPPARVASQTLVVHVASGDPLKDPVLADLVHRARQRNSLHILLVHHRQMPQLPSGFHQVVVGDCLRAQWWPPGLDHLRLPPGIVASFDGDLLRMGRY